MSGVAQKFRLLSSAGLICLVPVLFVCRGMSAADPQESKRLELLKTFVSEFVEITPGEGKFPQSFRMGTENGEAPERPVHEVRFDYRFAIAKYEVPQNLYELVMGENPSRWKGPRNSAEQMTFEKAVRFCEKITALLREAELIGEDEEIRLPSEAEWEYCCRAGTTTAYSFGDEATAPGDEGNRASRLDPYAWHTGNAAGNDPPVGVLKPNPWGLYDMHGYLWEFVSDVWHPNYEGAPSDGSPRTGDRPDTDRVIRGGSWRERYDRLRSAAREAVSVETRRDDVGFRCVKSRVKKPKK